MSGSKAKPIGVIVEEFPSLTETFIRRELEVLRDHGQNIAVFALRRGRLSDEANDGAAASDQVIYIPRRLSLAMVGTQLMFVLRSPRVFVRTLVFVFRAATPRPREVLSCLLQLPRAVYVAACVDRMEIPHLHAHFANLATTISLLSSHLCKVTYSFTAHARDIYVRPTMLSQKIAHASFVVTCTEFNRNYLLRATSGHYGDKIHRVYHGVDSTIYKPMKARSNTAGCATANRKQRPLVVLMVARLEPKKGTEYLVRACDIMRRRGERFLCIIAGDGPERHRLDALVDRLGVRDIVRFVGAQSEQQLRDRYRDADVFVLPSVVAADGDHDGLPNVLIEAMAMELSVVSTKVGGIPEIVEHGTSGLLVEQADVQGLAKAVAALLSDPDRRSCFGKSGRQKVQSMFDATANSIAVLKLLKAAAQ